MSNSEMQKNFLEVLEKVSRSLTMQRFSGENLGSSLELISKEFGAKSATVWLIPPDKSALKLTYYYNLPTRFIHFFEHPKNWPRPGEGIIGKVFKDHQMTVEYEIENNLTVPDKWKFMLTEKIVPLGMLVSHPLFSDEGKMAGVFNLYFDKPRAITETEQLALKITACYLGAVVEGQRTYAFLNESNAELEKERDQMAALGQAIKSLSISGEYPLPESTNELFESIGKAIGAHGIAIWSQTKDKKSLRISASRGLKLEYKKYFDKHPYKIKNGENAILTQAFLHQKPAFTQSIWSDKKVLRAIPRDVKNMIKREGYISLASFPLLVENDMYGVLNFYFSTAHKFEAGEQQILQIAASTASIAIGNARYKNRLNKVRNVLRIERDQLGKLYQGIETLRIAPQKSMEQVLNELMNTIGEAIGTHAIAIWRPTSDGKHLAIFASRGLTEGYVKIFEKNPLSLKPLSIVGKAAFEKQPVFSYDVRKEKSLGELTKELIMEIEKEATISLASLPLLIADNLFGTLNFYFSTPHAFSKGERYILGVAANTVAIAIENTQQRQELRDIQDALAKTLKDTEISREKSDQEKNKTDLIIKNFADGILIFNNRMEVQMINPIATKILKVTEGDILGKELQEVAALLHLEPFLNFHKKGGRRTFRKEMPLSDATTAEVTAVPVLSSAKNQIGTMVVIHDITREKHIEQLKTEFVSLAAHQLRTPLSAIKWVFNMLMMDNTALLSKEQKDLMNIGYQSNERMITLVNDLLDVTRIEEGKYIYKTSPVNITKLIQGIINSRYADAKKRGIDLTLQILNRNIPPVMLDKEKFIIAFQNLIDNSLIYTPKGGEVTCVLEYQTKISEMKLTIRDTGIGIPDKQQGRVFQKFFRAANAIKIHTTGTGLGLYIIKNIIEAHGGKIWFESAENKGTAFYISLPTKA